MALGNLIAFIYLTMKIETLNTSRHEEQIKIQNNQIEIQRKITKCNLQSEFIKDVNKIFIPVEQDLEKLYAESFLDKIQVQLIFTVNNGTAWFNSLEENKNLDNLIDKLEEIRTEINKRKPNEDALVKLTFQLIEFKMTFIDSLKKEMMDELNQ